MENIVFNDVWGWDIALEMTFLAIASFSTLFAYLSYREGQLRDAVIGAAVAAVLPVFSLIILNLHLLKPEASYLLFLSPQPRSWMLYGGIGMSSLIALSALFALFAVLPSLKVPLLSRLSPLSHSSAFMNALGVLMILAGVFVSLYTGLLMSYERGIPFWHSAALPAIALFMGIAGGSSLYAFIRPADQRVSFALLSSLALLVAVYLAHLMVSLLGSPAAHASATKVLGSGLFQVTLLLSVLAVVSLAANMFWFRTRYVPIIAGAIGLITIFVLRLLLLEAGAWEFPVI
ncbi:MAG: polysulfide reductase NrfD [Acidilobaceae archaeon]|nr:polysulfide reductase NrfD [Acidilobaceae archaeon]MCX8165204.1 polysulfide reductase NrfD [Acidilobaceae archaeon]MDW7974280.1 NrfD/PsrC family molybdoenzyme membrane anchor subunit [Sulfolobales archaeon]